MLLRKKIPITLLLFVPAFLLFLLVFSLTGSASGGVFLLIPVITIGYYTSPVLGSLAGFASGIALTTGLYFLDREIFYNSHVSIFLLGTFGLLISGAVVGYLGWLARRLKTEIEAHRKTIQDRDLLLREIHHRIKNNLNIIKNMIYLAGEEGLKNTDCFLKEIQSKIDSVSLIHSKLYMTSDFESVSFCDYSKDLIVSILNSFSLPQKKPRLTFQCAPVSFDIDTTITLGLVISELVTNALKYGLKGDINDRIDFRFERGDTQLYLSISNNGTALPEDFDIEKSGSLGLHLILSVIEKLRGRIEIFRHPQTEFSIMLPRDLIEKPEPALAGTNNS